MRGVGHPAQDEAPEGLHVLGAAAFGDVDGAFACGLEEDVVGEEVFQEGMEEVVDFVFPVLVLSLLHESVSWP